MVLIPIALNMELMHAIIFNYEGHEFLSGISNAY
jgi:hypothetical protein